MLPGKTYTPDDLLRIAWRRKWLIVLPFLLVSAGTAVVSYMLPNKYRSETLIAVIPQKLPESLVKSTVTTRIQDRLQAIQQKVLSRPSLEAVIQEFNLYKKERRTWMMEDIIQKMATKDIRIEILKSDAFRVSYVNEDPRLAQKVAEKVAASFTQESLNDRVSIAQNATTFLGAELETARRRLADIDQKLAQYQMKHAGELPTELQSNLTMLNNLQLQLQQLNEAVNRDRERRLVLERLINDLSEPLQSMAAVVPAGDPSGAVSGSVADQLRLWKARYQALRLRFKETHPAVEQAQKMIRDLETKLQAEALERPLSAGPDPTPATPEEAARLKRLHDARVELELVDHQIANKQAEEKGLLAQRSAYQARVEATPSRVPELTNLVREYDSLKKSYDSLVERQEQAKISANMEDREIGEQFRTLDFPRIPEVPISPNRPLINLAGALAGLALGVGMVAFLEYRDTSFRTDEEVVKVLALPVVAVIPLMLSAGERKKLRRRTLLVGTASAVVIVAAVAAGVFFFLRYGL